VNNVYVNVGTENWPTARQQKEIRLPSLTEHSMISVRTVHGSFPIILLIGGFSSYLADGITPDPASYNRDIYYSFENGFYWYVRGPKSRTQWQPQSYVETQWMPPRSGAAIFAHTRMLSRETVIFVHGGRHFDGNAWTNGGALDDLWFFILEGCIFPEDDMEMWIFSGPCQMTQVHTSPSIPRYFHRVLSLAISGTEYYILTGGFAPDGIAALQSPVYGHNSTFGVYFFVALDLTLASAYRYPLNFIWSPILPDAPLFSTSALVAAQYNEHFGEVFMFGGSNVDFSRFPSISSTSYTLFNNLWTFKFVPGGKSFLRKLKMIGHLPSNRVVTSLMTSRDRISFVGGVDKHMQYYTNVFDASLSKAHPNFTQVFGDALKGGVVGSMSHIFILAQTILLKPAVSCESCFSASVQGEAAGAPAFNLAFEAAGIDLEQSAAIYKSSFIPLVSGEYTISVTTLQSSVEDGMPFVQRIQVLSGVTCASTSHFLFSETTVAGSNVKFVVNCLDAFANSRPGGDEISATVQRIQVLSDKVLEPATDEVFFKYSDLKSGTHSLELIFTRSSMYSIVSKLGLHAVQGTSFLFTVLPKSPYCHPAPSKCNTLVIGELDSTFAGQAKPL
jgi:hypothetical protein